jgi:uncharacterized protein YcfJ
MKKKDSYDPWKYVALGLIGVFTLGATGVLVAKYADSDPQPREVAQQSRSHAAYDAPPAPAPAKPSARDIRDCNDYARTDKAKESFKGGLFGSALGAALGAAGGAIADGGKGAGKGAGIGALVGAVGGSLYGLNKANQQDQRSIAAYDACMRDRGF